MGLATTIAVLFGGPSPERGISINSARSLADHLEGDGVTIIPIYFDLNCNPYQLPLSYLYSNTPSDFDFKLQNSFSPLSREQLGSLLQGVSLTFPAMHGKFGEDGGIQELLESYGVPFVGSSSSACKSCFDKSEALKAIAAIGMKTQPMLVLDQTTTDGERQIEQFLKVHQIRRAIVKPAVSGSSIGVSAATNAAEAMAAVHELMGGKTFEKIVVEPFCKGREFTIVLLEAADQQPVSLIPVEIETGGEIFNYRNKYLATGQSKYFCPPRFSEDQIASIRHDAETIFRAFGLKDWARFDGWLLDDGTILFADFNPVSGMEQNSFVFLQAATIGMSHRDLLRYVANTALAKAHRPLIAAPHDRNEERSRTQIGVLFGGPTAERQVSVMSGTNVWLKLQRSRHYTPVPYLLKPNNTEVWRLPYPLTLRHTVEEIIEACEHSSKTLPVIEKLRTVVLSQLKLEKQYLSVAADLPQQISLTDVLKAEKVLFIALHGGDGESGILQGLCKAAGVSYNGSDPETSALCMNKYETGNRIRQIAIPGVGTCPKLRHTTADLLDAVAADAKAVFSQLQHALGTPLIVKPIDDGCSAGIAVIQSERDLALYCEAIKRGDARIFPQTLTGENRIIEMPHEQPSEILFESFIRTDRIVADHGSLEWSDVTGWFEVTIGVIGRRGELRAFNPSITVANGGVLSLEEKFQGGTGVNITPPPDAFVPTSIINSVKERAVEISHALGISGYARLDLFVHRKTGECLLIEANTLPGLSPSTVLFQQALAEQSPLYPRELLETILSFRDS